jgi:predicted dehydrogenase
MSPINIGIIGLSVKGTAWAKIAHLPYLKASSKYKVSASFPPPGFY